MRRLACVAKIQKEDDEGAVLFVRGFPRELLAKLKAAAALDEKTLAQYAQELCQTHVDELERKGRLPKTK